MRHFIRLGIDELVTVQLTQHGMRQLTQITYIGDHSVTNNKITAPLHTLMRVFNHDDFAAPPFHYIEIEDD